MRLRMLSLLLVACAAGTSAGVVGTPRAATAPAILPDTRAAIPVVRARDERPCPVPLAFHETFRRAASEAGVPLSMLVAVAKVESGLDPAARSPAGAHGLLQVLPETAEELSLDVFRTDENVLAGALYLRQMLDRFRSADLALAAYNAGPTAVEREGASPNDETVAYVAKVTAEWRKLVGCS